MSVVRPSTCRATVSGFPGWARAAPGQSASLWGQASWWPCWTARGSLWATQQRPVSSITFAHRAATWCLVDYVPTAPIVSSKTSVLSSPHRLAFLVGHSGGSSGLGRIYLCKATLTVVNSSGSSNYGPLVQNWTRLLALSRTLDSDLRIEPWVHLSKRKPLNILFFLILFTI